MLREVLTYPNKTLKSISKDVNSFDNELYKLLDDMYDTMIYKGGVGLAAIQIGVALNVLIINLTNKENIQDKNELIEIINPKILIKEGEQLVKEGCLSVPNFFEEVKRYKRIKIRYFDRFQNEKELDNNDFLAVAIQHEMDHLKGELFIEKLSILKRKKFEKEYKKELRKSKVNVEEGF